MIKKGILFLLVRLLPISVGLAFLSFIILAIKENLEEDENKKKSGEDGHLNKDENFEHKRENINKEVNDIVNEEMEKSSELIISLIVEGAGIGDINVDTDVYTETDDNPADFIKKQMKLVQKEVNNIISEIANDDQDEGGNPNKT